MSASAPASAVQCRLYALLSRISGLPPERIKPDMPIFGKGLALDSLSGVDLVAGLEAEFGVRLEDIDLHMEALDDVGRLLAMVKAAPAERWAQLLLGVAAAARLQEGPGGVEKVLCQIRTEPGATSRELAAACGLPTPTVAALRKEMVKAGLLAGEGQGAFLSHLGQEITDALFPPFLPAAGPPARPYGRFAGSDLFAELVSRLSPLLALRPEADTALDQAKCLPETVAARALLALEYGAVCGRRIACVGDDDFTSLGLGMLGTLLEGRGALGPVKITVLDIDERIVQVLRGMADQHGLPIAAYRHDLRQPVPERLAGWHDAFFTDPPYTVPGAELFAARGRELCKPGGGLAFFSFASKGPAEMLAVHQALAGLGLLIRELLPGFNRYEGASLWGNQSQMLVFAGTSATTPLAPGSYADRLYTADFRRKT